MDQVGLLVLILIRVHSMPLAMAEVQATRRNGRCISGYDEWTNS